MKPLTMILAEAGLELVPKSIQSHPAVIKSAKRRNKDPSEILLDISFHYKAMKGLDKWYKRGRPDIVHISLLNALSSPLNIVGLLNVYVHTINNIIIGVDPLVRIPRNYNRFVGLMEQLLTVGKVPPKVEKPLLWIENKTLNNFISTKKFDSVVVMHEQGVMMTPRNLGEVYGRYMIENKNICIIIGAFQHGDFEKETLLLADQLISIFPKSLDTWIVVSRVLEGIENALNIYLKSFTYR